VYQRKHYVISERLVPDPALWVPRSVLHSLGQKVKWKIDGNVGKTSLRSKFFLFNNFSKMY
jgi:hypothetical protein